MTDVIRGHEHDFAKDELRDVNTVYVSGSNYPERKSYGLLVVPATSGGAVNSNNPLDVLTDTTSTIYNGWKTVTASGTSEALSGNTIIKTVCLRSLPNNSNNIYIGNSSVNSTNGYVLPSGEAISIEINNLNKIYLDADTNGEGVSFLAVN